MLDENDRPTTKPDPQTHTPQQEAAQERCLGGRFVVQDRIGAGGGAVVVRARDRHFPSTDVAIKLLRSRDPELQRRFTEESEVLRDMDHPAIVRVLAHDRDGDDLYTVLELIEGPDLGEQLLREGPLPWRQVVGIGIQIAGALEAVHRKGVIHRDVKPTNIMLADAGEPMRVKLIDFGVVRITENHRLVGAARRPTDVGATLGTPAYLPLEAGLVPADARFDVFALGTTLFELLTGVLPEVPLRPLREACRGCDAPEDLGLALAAALALEPEDRTQTAAELGRALAAVRAAHPNRGAPSVRIDGRYELIGLVGTGAKGDAHLAVHRGTGHDVVLKFLRSTDPDDVLRFAREAKLLKTFDHPALPRFFDHAPEADPPYIAMAHAPGRPASRLCSPPRLKPAEVAAVGLKLAQVLAVVHARGVLHRDINASNVLIDASGAVTLLDFGCAALAEKFYDVPTSEQRYLTPPEARVVIPDGQIGQLAWSAPEVHAGRGWTDRSDVYSLGHLLFRLLTGKVPTKGADPPTSPQKFASTCPDDLALAIVRALYIDPQERLGATELAEALQDALETEEEAFERVLAQAKQRPPLRLVPSEPERTDWTEHPVPDATSEPPATFELAAPTMPPATPAPSTTAPVAPGWWHRTRFIAGSVMTVGLAWWLGNLSATFLPGEPATRPGRSESAVFATPIVPEPTPPQRPRAPPEPVAKPTLLPIDRALAEVSPKLRGCSRVKQGLLVVAFKVADGDDFATVAVNGETTEKLDRCVRDATARLRFQPPGLQDFTEEYTP